MREFFDWFRQHRDPAEPWLILGKGPSFARFEELDTGGFHTLGLNHVVLQQPVEIAHAIDLEVIEQCGQQLLDRAGYLLMPWVPHLRSGGSRAVFGPGPDDLQTHCRRNPILAAFAEQGRLLWYNLFSAGEGRFRPGSPVVPATDFSATAALNLLAQAGVGKVRSLGVDGGRGYSEAFRAMESQTMLQTGQPSYDTQFQGFADTILRTGIDFAPLDLDSPVQVYVGTQPEQMLAVEVLAHSIRRHASLSVSVQPLFQAIAAAGLQVPAPRDPRLRPRTPFSYQRFAIPALNGYRGRALYLDSDMQVFRDIRELWTWPFDGADVLAVAEPPDSGRRPQFSVMALDCERLGWDAASLIDDLEAGRWSYEEFMYELAPAQHVRRVLPAAWNDLERHAGDTALTHYTDMHTQPWLTAEHVLGRVWCEDLFHALELGAISPDFVRDQVERGWVRPSLLHQIEHRVIDPLLLPYAVLQRDRTQFVPPHAYRRGLKPLAGYGRYPGPAQRLVRRLYAHGRDSWKSLGGERVMRGLRRRLGRLALS